MRTRSERFDQTIASSHEATFRVAVLEPGNAAEVMVLDDIIGGSVTLDQTAAVRGRCDINLPLTDELLPTTPQHPLAPYGNEVRVSRGITYTDGTEELISLGIFRIQSVEVEDSAETGTIRISGLDRAQRVSDAKFQDPFSTLGSEQVEDVIEDVVNDVYPDVQTDFLAPVHTLTPVAVEEASDRWEFAQELARSIGAELYFDGDGVLVLRTIQEPGQGSAVATLAEGDSGVLLDTALTWNREDTYNRVVVTGENTETDETYRGEAINDNPASPTYYYGTFGQVPLWYSSPLVGSDAQAQQAAEGLLAREVGTAKTVSCGTIVNPALEPGDSVRITRERSGIDEDHLIDSMTIPLSADQPMTLETRATEVL